MAAKAKVWGMLVEFDSVKATVDAATKTRDAGYTRWDTHTPFPVHGLSDAMGMRDTKLPWIVLGAGLTGAVLGLGMQIYMNAIDYPINISGKPLVSLPAFIPIVFEMTILFAALTAFGAMLVLNGLPKLYQPVFKSERFRRVTNDRFFIVIEAKDPLFDRERTETFLASLGGAAAEVLED